MTTPTSTPVSSVSTPSSGDNQFQLTDHNKKTNVTLRLDRSSPPIQDRDTQGPTLEYQGAEGTFTFTSQQIVKESTSLGQMFTVTLNIVPDLRSLSFTLVLPTVTNDPNHSSQAFETIAIKSENHLRLVGSLPPGANTTYSVMKMHGTAARVEVPQVLTQ